MFPWFVRARVHDHRARAGMALVGHVWRDRSRRIVTPAVFQCHVIVTATRTSCPMLAEVPRANPTDGRCRGGALALGVWLIGSLGCIREPLPEFCPNVEVGELVISELRGPQDGQDSFGDYLEVYNAAGKTVDLQGMTVRLRSAGGDELEFFVRESIEVDAGSYAIIGPGLPDDRPDWIDYGVGWDISGGNVDNGDYPQDVMRYVSAFVELEACEEIIDEMFYAVDTIPKLGTLACGNAETPPSAEANDDSEAGCWCNDIAEADGQPLFGLGLPGSPGGPNRCQ
jgi:hypothetical protein